MIFFEFPRNRVGIKIIFKILIHINFQCYFFFFFKTHIFIIKYNCLYDQCRSDKNCLHFEKIENDKTVYVPINLNIVYYVILI